MTDLKECEKTTANLSESGTEKQDDLTWSSEKFYLNKLGIWVDDVAEKLKQVSEAEWDKRVSGGKAE